VNGWNNGEFPRLLWDARLDYYEADLGRLYLRKPWWTVHTLRAMPAAIREIRQIAATVRPDWLVFSDPQLLLWSAWTLPRARRLLYLHSRPTAPSLALWGAAARRHVDRVACVSQFVADAVARTPLGRVPAAIVHNGIDMPPAVARPPETPPVRLGIIGGISQQKQHLVLLRAIAELKHRLPANSFRLHIVGRALGRFPRTVEAEIRSLGIADRIAHIGFTRERDAIYRDLDVVVAPALDEGFGLTVAEAGAYGLPVVAARSGALPEIVEHERTGLLFDAGDVGALARALERVILDGALRARLGSQARAWVADRFTVERMTEGFLAAIDGAA
jgi:glycosyltransferase involved in cell wall biosynthesis